MGLQDQVQWCGLGKRPSAKLASPHLVRKVGWLHFSYSWPYWLDGSNGITNVLSLDTSLGWSYCILWDSPMSEGLLPGGQDVH